MPITPFHIIAGFAVKSIFNKGFSWSIFALTNIAIDTEVIYYVITAGEASHKFFHTLLGSTMIAIICTFAGIPVCERLLNFWNKNLYNEKSLEKLKFLNVDSKINIFSSFAGAFIGAYSHILLDSLMHFDVKPFEPFFSTNFVGIVPINILHFGLLGLFVFGVIIYVIKKIFQKKFPKNF